jgi:DNA-binding NarL/FixJ family response regulator
MNLLVVDDHAVFREGLRLLLPNISPGVLINEAASVEAAIDECRLISYELVLLDLGLSATAGLDTLRAFRVGVPDTPVVVLSGDQEPRHIRAAVELGAMGFIPKSHSPEEMIAALRRVLDREIYLPRDAIGDSTPLGRDLADGADRAASVRSAFERLSRRQHEVAQLLLQAKSNKVIARRLNLSEGTVKAHVSAIYQIIGASSRAEALFIAANSGIKAM